MDYYSAAQQARSFMVTIGKSQITNTGVQVGLRFTYQNSRETQLFEAGEASQKILRMSRGNRQPAGFRKRCFIYLS